MREGVQLAQEINRFKIFASAKLIGHPLAVVSGIVAIQHGRDGIHTQAVDVEGLEPVQRVGQQEVADFVPAVIEDERAPVLMFALTGIGMFVQRGPVEARESVRVLREVSGHPVENHADTGEMTGIHKRAKFIRRAESTRRRKKSGDLVAPRRIVRMLHDGHQFDVRKSEPGDVRNQFVRQFPPRQRSIAVFRLPPPRPGMHLVNGHRGIKSHPSSRAGINPLGVLPRMPAEVGGDGRGLRRVLTLQRKRIRLREGRAAQRRLQFKFIRLSCANAGDKRLP